MEVLQENVHLQDKQNFRCLLVNFRRLKMKESDKTEVRKMRKIQLAGSVSHSLKLADPYTKYAHRV